MIDIDYFKKVNDTYGHDRGDIVLSQFSDIIKSTTRTIDTVARWGGEEFLILCPETNMKRATLMAERLLSNINAYEFEQVGHLSASIGIVTVNKDDTFEDSVNQADKYLYEAKSSGRNCYKSA